MHKHPEVAELYPDLPEINPEIGPSIEDFIKLVPEEEPEADTSGWSDLGGQARKFHYFPNNTGGTRALCGKWGIFRSHELQADEGCPTKDDCVACARKLGR
jgi:hypothetical protein